MLVDMISAIEVTASAAILVAVVSYYLSQNVGGRLRAGLAFGLWFLVVVALGATNALGSKNVGPPGLAAAVMMPVLVLCYTYFAVPSVRTAFLAAPLWLLIAVNFLRALGVSFIILYAENRLPAPFAPSAGWGDVFTGAAAIPLAWIVLRYGAQAKNLILAWNVIGLLDLVFAVGFGATSAPGPIQIFAGPPTTQIMTTLPWLIIPAFLVPIFVSLHIAIFYRLRVGVAQPSDQESLSASTA
jgi:hypothetical protein